MAVCRRVARGAVRAVHAPQGELPGGQVDVLHRMSLDTLSTSTTSPSSPRPRRCNSTASGIVGVRGPTRCRVCTPAKMRFNFAPLSNCSVNISLLTDMAKHGGIPWGSAFLARSWSGTTSPFGDLRGHGRRGAGRSRRRRRPRGASRRHTGLVTHRPVELPVLLGSPSSSSSRSFSSSCTASTSSPSSRGRGVTLDAWKIFSMIALPRPLLEEHPHVADHLRVAVAAAYPIAYYIALVASKRKYVSAPHPRTLPRQLLPAPARGKKTILGDQGVINSFLMWTSGTAVTWLLISP